MKSEGGFTLVEIVIVIAIIGLLAAIVIPNLQRSKAGGGRSPDLTVITNLWNHTVARVRVDGHTYLMFEHGVVHDEACPCKSK